MNLPIDTAHAFLRPSQLVALIEAVAAAHQHDEHDWIEWKSALDLSSAEDQWHIAKQILGFSNRTVATAERHAEGYAYLLVGVEPGGITGVNTIDHADLTKAVEKYVRPARWSPEYITVNDVEVLVIIVDPPTPGAPLYTARKGGAKHQEGAIFVRVPGRSAPASSSQISDLVQRVKAQREEIEVEVRLESDTIASGHLPAFTRISDRVKAERWRLLAPVATFYNGQRSSFLGMELLRPPADKRSEEEYLAGVETYLAKLKTGGRGTSERWTALSADHGLTCWSTR